MTQMILEREWRRPLDLGDLADMVDDTLGCFSLHRVNWEESFISADRRKLLCRFAAPDAESVRIALRQLDTDMRVHWVGSVHNAAGIEAADIGRVNVAVIRTFEDPVELESLQAIEDENIHCLEAHRVRFIRTFFARDRKRMACFYEAPDAESVRIAQRQATMPFDTVWACERLTTDSF